MSLIGIDVGSSAVKTAAYQSDGKLLAAAREAVIPRRPQPGWWENDPVEVWAATLKTLGSVVRARAVRRDLPVVIAVSASGREAFPVDEEGLPLGSCIMTADTRGEELEKSSAAHMDPLDWYQVCGHIPERMDPANRLLWWRRHYPAVMDRARYFLGWHEFLTLRLGGRAVTDHSLGSKWFTYDLAQGGWSLERLAEFDLDPRMLPELEPWGKSVATLKASLAAELGLAPTVQIAVGALDSTCAAVGSGASGDGICGLLCGSWEDLLVPTKNLPSPAELIRVGCTFGPHPGVAGSAVLALSPNGTTIVDWARSLLGIPLRKLEAELQASGPLPSPVLEIPHYSGATIPWRNARSSRGSFVGLTLASSKTDVIKALMEGIFFDLLLTMNALRQAGVEIQLLRASGGGTRSDWWMQLKADLSNLPVEVISQPEPGTVGAALLAGLATGTFSTLEEGGKLFVTPARRYEPNRERARLYEERLDAYRTTISSLLGLDWLKGEPSRDR